MRIEVPQFKRCCYCVPLRYGLLGWSYFMLVPLTCILVAYIIRIWYLVNYTMWSECIAMTIVFLILFTHYASTFLFIVAAHKKSSQLLKIYYTCALGTTLAYFILAISGQVYTLVSDWGTDSFYEAWFWRFFFIFFLMKMIYIGFQLYIIAMVRTELLKLESNCRFEFSNIAAEAESTCYDVEPESSKNNETIEQTAENVEEEEDEIEIYLV